METRLHLGMLAQPDDFTCGPTCLHAVYDYYGESIPLETVVAETPRLENGGTLAVLLALHALRRGYGARIYTYNLQLFDPTWFEPGRDVAERLALQAEFKTDPKLRTATSAYREFLARGGELRLEDLSPDLIARHLDAGEPILTGLSSTYLYRASREFGPLDDEDDVRGEPTGHFVVLCGHDPKSGAVLVADPHAKNPYSATRHYEASADRVIGAILLGVITYDANLLILEPPD